MEGLTQFVVGWRTLLQETLSPTNLPPGWSVDAPVMAKRKAEEGLAD